MPQKNRREAIAAHCLDCSGGEHKRRTDCEFTDCRLYPYRTGSGKQDSVERNRDIHGFCKDDCSKGGGYPVKDCPSKKCPLYAFRIANVNKRRES